MRARHIPETAKLSTSLFQSNCCDNDDPLKHLSPHVRHIVDENQAEFNKDPIANRLLIVHLNINGLKTKINCLKKFTQEMKPDIICVSETNNPDINDVKIQGYEMCLKYNPDESILRFCGGVAIYVKNDLIAVEYPLTTTFWRQGEAETAWIGVTKTQSSIVVGVIYRHSNGCKKSFQQIMRKVLVELNSLNKLVYVLGDINFDLMKHSHLYIGYCKMLQKYSFKLLITTHTRVSNKSSDGENPTESLIDHIYTNDQSRINAGTKELKTVTDHYLVFCNVNF